MAKGAQDEAFLHGYTVLFGSTDNNYIQEEKFLDALKAKMVDGIIYVSSNPATREKLLENEKFLLTSRKACDKINVTASEAACTL